MYKHIATLSVTQTSVIRQITQRLVNTKTVGTFWGAIFTFLKVKVGMRLIFRSPAPVIIEQAKRGLLAQGSPQQKERTSGKSVISAPAGAGTPVEKVAAQGGVCDAVTLKRAKRRAQQVQKKRQTLQPIFPKEWRKRRYKINAGLTPKLTTSARESSSAPK